MVSLGPDPEESFRQAVPQLQLIAVVGGAALAWWGIQDLRFESIADVEPQEITCAALAAQGPGSNAHVRMTEFELLVDDFAVETTETSRSTEQLLKEAKGGRSGPSASFWERAWIPAVPAGAAPVEGPAARAPREIRVLVQTGWGSESFLASERKKKVIVGTIVNAVESIDPRVLGILSTAYPGLDPRRVWILEEGRTPKGTKGGWWKILGGLALVGGGVGWFLWLRRSASETAEMERRLTLRRRDRARERRRRQR